MSSESAPLEDKAESALRPEIPGILRLAWPAVASNLAYSMVGLVDIKIVASLGSSAVAAVTTGHRIFWVLQAVMIAITAGTTALVARAWGAKNKDEAERVTRASLWLCMGVAGAMTLPAFFFADQLAGIFELDDATVADAASFIRVMSLFNVAFAMSMVIGSALRAAGDTLTPLWIGLGTNCVNVFLVYGLVFGQFGLPAMGVRGAALATGLSLLSGSMVSLGLWWGGKLRIPRGSGVALTQQRVRQLIRIGYPAGLEQAAMQVGFIVFLWIVSLYGTAPYAAYGIGVQILSFSFVVGIGFNIAASTHVGQKLGAGDPEGAEHSGWRAMRLAVLTMAILSGLIIMTAESIASFIIDDPEVVRLTVVFIYVLGAAQPLMAIDFTLGGALRGAGDTRFPLVTTIAGLVVVRGCVAGLLALLDFGVEWVFCALLFDYCVKSSLMSWRFRRRAWQKIVI
ncbi:MAG TPA: MATE family efflux transporter [Myxococcales bacterium]|nr:MATE family efflux transporter [Myxococcales bacterium]